MNVVRLQFEISEEQLSELEQLAKLGGLRTKKDLLNNALTLLKWAVRQRANGRAVVSVSETGNQKELEMPFLEAIAAAMGPERDDKRDGKRLLTPAF